MREVIINRHVVEVEQRKTDIYGLESLPQMISYDNDADWAPFTRRCHREVSQQDYDLVKRVSKDYKTHGIVEIGVARNQEGSFTYALLDGKPDDVPYLGIDLEDKTFLDDKSKNIYTIMANSFEQERIRDYMKEIGMEKISILFIDGWHSLNAVINDWLYADMLSDDAVVLFHDTNYHPGPAVFMEFIDKKLFKVEKHFHGQDDYGVGVAYKINE